MSKKVEIFSSKRLRQILNDIKRDSSTAKKELNVSNTKLNKYLNTEKPINLNLIRKICSVYPIHPQEMISSKILFNKPFKYFSAASSKKTARILKRGKLDYYEYRDTVITNNSPFKPEWIRELCFVKNNNPQNKILEWNKGHLLHQLTYFVGKVNFYYIDEYNKKRVAVMNTGDTMYISPYTPHTFATRDKDLKAHIIAVTFTGKITNEIQNHLQGFKKDNLKDYISFNSLKGLVDRKLKDNCLNYPTFEKMIKEKNLRKKILDKKISISLKKKLSKYLDISFNSFEHTISSKKTIIKKREECLEYNYPANKNGTIIIDLLSLNYLSGCKMFQIKVNNKSKSNFYDSSKHQYIYILKDNISFKHNKKIINLKVGDSLYVKPFEKFKLYGNGGSALIIRLEGNLSDQIIFELSKINSKNIGRVINEKEKWY
jgi:methylphosphonate synthase